jgi:hypothetical protein
MTGPPLKNVSNTVLPLAQSGMGRPLDPVTSAANIVAELAINVTISTILQILGLFAAYRVLAHEPAEQNYASRMKTATLTGSLACFPKIIGTKQATLHGER